MAERNTYEPQQVIQIKNSLFCWHSSFFSSIQSIYKIEITHSAFWKYRRWISFSDWFDHISYFPMKLKISVCKHVDEQEWFSEYAWILIFISNSIVSRNYSMKAIELCDQLIIFVLQFYCATCVHSDESLTIDILLSKVSSFEIIVYSIYCTSW